LAVNQVLTFWAAGRARDFDLPKGRRKTRCAFMSEIPSNAGEATAKRDAILVVDDERPILDMFTAALQGQFDVVTATSAREAEFNLRKKEFKVVVADHLMPGGNGMNLLVRCREEYPHMQRVLVTGYMKPEMLLRSVNEAALYRYLLKPVQMGDLLRIVQDAVRAHDVAVKAG
jgi:DNA-binding NtrC family response regulator